MYGLERVSDQGQDIPNLKISQNEDGRYCVKLPCRLRQINFLQTINLCKMRLKSRIRKLSKQPEILLQSDIIIKDQEQKGIIEEDSSQPDG